MPKNLLNCVIKDWEEGKPTKSFDPKAPNNVTKHVSDLFRRWKSVNTISNISKTNKLNTSVFFEHLHNIGDIAGATTYSKGYYDRLVNRMSYTLPSIVKRWVARTGGNANDFFARMSDRGRGFILGEVAKLEVGKKALDLSNVVNDVIKKNGLTDVDRATLSLDLVRLSSFPHLIQYSGGATPAAQKFISREQKRIWDKLHGMGLGVEDIRNLTKYSDLVVQAEFELALIGKQLDMDVSAVLSGALGRFLNPEAQRVFRVIEQGGKELPEFQSIRSGPAQWLKDSRNTNVFLPGDAETLDYLFKESGIYTRIANKHGIDPKSITFEGLLAKGDDDIISDMLLNEIKDSELDFLIESGLMSKIPIDTPQIFEELVKRYELPFKGLNEMFLYNPEKMVQTYTRQLEEMAVEKSQMWGLISAAENKIGVPKSVMAQDPEGFKGFVPLADAIPNRLKKRITDQKIIDRLEDLHVNPVVAKHYKAMQEVMSNPVKVAILGDVLNTARRVLQSSWLATAQWFTRNIVGNTATLEMMGIHVQDYGKYVAQMMYGQENFPKMLSDKPTLYGDKSVKELYERGVSLGLLDDYTDLGRAGDNPLLKTLPNSLKKAVGTLAWMAREYPDQLPKEVFQMFREGIENVNGATILRYLAYGNAMADNSAKLAMAEQLMNPNRLIRRVGGETIDTLPAIKNMDEAWDYVRAHWYDFSTLPQPGQSMWYDTLSSAQPFFGFMYKNFQHVGRMLIENPAKFGSVLKLLHRKREEYKKENTMADYVKRSDWSKDEHQDYPFVIPGEYTVDGKDAHFDYSLGNLIPFLGAYNTMVDGLDVIGAFNENRPPSDHPDNPFRRDAGKGKIRQIIEENRIPLADPLNAVIEMFARAEESLIENEGKERTLFGINMSGSTYGAITGVLAPLRQLDKVFQYTPLAGKAPDINERTGEWQPGEPSVFGDVPTRPTRGQQPKAFGDIVTPLMDAIGMAPNYVDDMYYTYRTIKELQIQIGKAKRELNQYRYAVSKATDENEVKQLKEQHIKHMKWAYMVTVQWEIIQKWRKDEGIPSNKALEQIRRHNLRIDDLASPEEIERIAADNWVKFQTDYNNSYEEPTLRP